MDKVRIVWDAKLANVCSNCGNTEQDEEITVVPIVDQVGSHKSGAIRYHAINGRHAVLCKSCAEAQLTLQKDGTRVLSETVTVRKVQFAISTRDRVVSLFHW